MTYRNLSQCVQDLKNINELVQIDDLIDPYLEIAAISRRIFAQNGPSILFTNVKNTPFPVLVNLYGSHKRIQFIFRDTLQSLKTLMSFKNPKNFIKNPFHNICQLAKLRHIFPKKVNHGSVLTHSTHLEKLPQIQFWPQDGGAYITLPLVYTENILKPGFNQANLGMYRIQISGNEFIHNDLIGIHYQIHRGIGIHHQIALNESKPLPVNIFVGGSPAMTLASIMPLPENISEIYFAGLLAGHRIPFIKTKSSNHLPIYADADFCIQGEIINHQLLPEGPFGDHLGYYSLRHDYPVLKVHHVWHKNNAIWPCTTVGRPPQEDTIFGEFIHELTGDIIPDILPGIHSIHAVDAAGVHPLLLAIGSERYTPYAPNSYPQEILTQANAILGQGQLSLAKYLWICNYNDNPALDIHNIAEFIDHILSRIEFHRDIHFITQTTMDTLDYSSGNINQGSKVIFAATGAKKRTLIQNIPSSFKLPEGFKNPKVVLPGILAIQSPSYKIFPESLSDFCHFYDKNNPINQFPLIILCDDSNFVSNNLNNFLWATFTKSNPSHDIEGIDSFIKNKHWGCMGSLVIDAREKPFHAPELIEDPQTEKNILRFAKNKSPLSRYF